MLPSDIKLPIELETYLVGKNIKYIIDRSRTIPGFSLQEFIFVLISVLLLIGLFGSVLVDIRLGPKICGFFDEVCINGYSRDPETVAIILLLNIASLILLVPKHLQNYLFPEEYYIFTENELVIFRYKHWTVASWSDLDSYWFNTEKEVINLYMKFKNRLLLGRRVMVPNIIDTTKVEELVKELKGQADSLH